VPPFTPTFPFSLSTVLAAAAHLEAARIAAQGDDWGQLAVYTGALIALALVCIAFATRAFRAYQGSL